MYVHLRVTTPDAVKLPVLFKFQVPAAFMKTFLTEAATLSEIPNPIPAVAARSAEAAVPPVELVVMDCWVMRSMKVAVPAKVATAPEPTTEPRATLVATAVPAALRFTLENP